MKWSSSRVWRGGLGVNLYKDIHAKLKNENVSCREWGVCGGF